jgi:hypothetical protein
MEAFSQGTPEDLSSDATGSLNQLRVGMLIAMLLSSASGSVGAATIASVDTCSMPEVRKQQRDACSVIDERERAKASRGLKAGESAAPPTRGVPTVNASGTPIKAPSQLSK